MKLARGRGQKKAAHWERLRLTDVGDVAAGVIDHAHRHLHLHREAAGGHENARASSAAGRRVLAPCFTWRQEAANHHDERLYD
jgi:hypothetical protein